MQRIVFLDVDGPLIPGRMYFRVGATYSSQLDLYCFCPAVVDMLNYLTDATGATIVFNSTHNDRGAEIAVKQAEYNRLRNLHRDVLTGFPDAEFSVSPDARRRAIEAWLDEHPDTTRHCVFDDAPLGGENFCHVDFNEGITTSHIAWALEHLTGLYGEGLGFTPGRSHVTTGLEHYRRHLDLRER